MIVNAMACYAMIEKGAGQVLSNTHIISIYENMTALLRFTQNFVAAARNWTIEEEESERRIKVGVEYGR